jgi:hypothetical protein
MEDVPEMEDVPDAPISSDQPPDDIQNWAINRFEQGKWMIKTFLDLTIGNHEISQRATCILENMYQYCYENMGEMPELIAKYDGLDFDSSHKDPFIGSYSSLGNPSLWAIFAYQQAFFESNGDSVHCGEYVCDSVDASEQWSIHTLWESLNGQKGTSFKSYEKTESSDASMNGMVDREFRSISSALASRMNETGVVTTRFMNIHSLGKSCDLKKKASTFKKVFGLSFGDTRVFCKQICSLELPAVRASNRAPSSAALVRQSVAARPRSTPLNRVESASGASPLASGASGASRASPLVSSSLLSSISYDRKRSEDRQPVVIRPSSEVAKDRRLRDAERERERREQEKLRVERRLAEEAAEKQIQKEQLDREKAVRAEAKKRDALQREAAIKRKREEMETERLASELEREMTDEAKKLAKEEAKRISAEKKRLDAMRRCKGWTTMSKKRQECSIINHRPAKSPVRSANTSRFSQETRLQTGPETSFFVSEEFRIGENGRPTPILKIINVGGYTKVSIKIRGFSTAMSQKERQELQEWDATRSGSEEEEWEVDELDELEDEDEGAEADKKDEADEADKKDGKRARGESSQSSQPIKSTSHTTRWTNACATAATATSFAANPLFSKVIHHDTPVNADLEMLKLGRRETGTGTDWLIVDWPVLKSGTPEEAKIRAEYESMGWMARD